MATNSAPLVAASSIIAGVVSPLTSLMMIGAERERAARRLDVIRVDAEPRPQQLAAIAIDEAAERGLEPRPLFVRRSAASRRAASTRRRGR